jgi:hypothetical protein
MKKLLTVPFAVGSIATVVVATSSSADAQWRGGGLGFRGGAFGWRGAVLQFLFARCSITSKPRACESRSRRGASRPR